LILRLDLETSWARRRGGRAMVVGMGEGRGLKSGPKIHFVNELNYVNLTNCIVIIGDIGEVITPMRVPSAASAGDPWGCYDR
jgi:hypothetical protein